MVIYSCSPLREFVAAPGEHVVYGTDESNPQGMGTVSMSPRGDLWVSNRPLRQIMRKYAYVRKIS